jgi:hypothetical protein
LSWHLTKSEKQDIKKQWEMEQQSASTSAVLDFLSAGQLQPRQGDVPARCLPQPVHAQ